MDIRKVQVTGGSSYIITLPKEWAEKVHIKKNDPLGLISQSDGTLLVTKNISESQIQTIKEFDVSSINDPAYLFRLLIGAYIAGFTTIRIVAKHRFSPFVRGVVRDFAQMTIGPEVVEETESTIALKDLLNPMEMPFDNTMKRMYVIVKNMHIDVITAIETKNSQLAVDVITRDNDVDRLHWLIARQMNVILKNVNLSRKMELSTSLIVNTYLISRIIERIGDHAVRMAENAIKISDVNLSEDMLRAIKKASELSIGVFDRSIISFFKSDLTTSHKNIETLKELDDSCERINALSMDEDTSIAITLHYIAESIRRCGEYSGDISETVINYLVEEQPF
jgi:phosphate uptake regulator